MTRPPAQLVFVIVSYQSAGIIDRCLDAIDALSQPVSIVVIDNHSEDDTVARLAARGITATDSGSNLGFAPAANLGARQARGKAGGQAESQTGNELLCFLNPDCMVTEQVVSQGLAALVADPRCIAVPSFRHDDGSIVAGRQPGYTRRKLLADLLETAGKPAAAASIKRRLGCDATDWHWPLGACLFVRREFFDEIGGFDQRYFMYMEDVQIGISAHQAGGRVVALDSVISHRSGQGSDIPMERRLEVLDQARIQYARHHYGRGFAALLSGIRQRGLRARGQA